MVRKQQSLDAKPESLGKLISSPLWQPKPTSAALLRTESKYGASPTGCLLALADDPIVLTVASIDYFQRINKDGIADYTYNPRNHSAYTHAEKDGQVRVLQARSSSLE